MATQKPTVSVPVLDLLSALLRENSVHQRAATIATYLEQFFPASVIAIYRFDAAAGTWMLAGSTGDGRPEGMIRQGGALEMAAELNGPGIWSGSRLRLEQYAHLGVSRHVESLVCIPLPHD